MPPMKQNYGLQVSVVAVPIDKTTPRRISLLSHANNVSSPNLTKSGATDLSLLLSTHQKSRPRRPTMRAFKAQSPLVITTVGFKFR
jgi:hypothetical protein